MLDLILEISGQKVCEPTPLWFATDYGFLQVIEWKQFLIYRKSYGWIKCFILCGIVALLQLMNYI